MTRQMKFHCRFCHRRLDSQHKRDGCEDCEARNMRLVPIYHEIIQAYPQMAQYSMAIVFAKLWENWKKKTGLKIPKPQQHLSIDPLKVF